ncbi:MAG: hypothetical protein ACRC6K_04320 [Fusobacteriaceae bacterium]
MFKYMLMYALSVISIFGYINIYPSFFYEKLPKEGLTKSFVLTNRTKEKIRYRLYIENKVLEKEMTIEVYPKSITLSPQEEKEVKIAIKPSPLLKEGVYNKILVVKEVPIPLQKKKSILTEFKMNLGLYYGNIELLLNFETEETKDGIEIKIKNNGERVGLLNIYLKEIKSKENKKSKKEIKNEKFIDSIILKKDETYIKKINGVKKNEVIIIKEENEKEIKKIIVKGV